MLWQLRPNDVEIQLLAHTRNLLLSLEEATGVFPGFTQNGGLFIASGKASVLNSDVYYLLNFIPVSCNTRNVAGGNYKWIVISNCCLSQERLEEYKRLKTIGHAFGVESYVLSPEETKKLYPLMNVDDLYGTLYVPGDGNIDPAEFCTALTRGAKQLGAQVVEKCPVTGLLTEESWNGKRRVSGVSTPIGTIKTNCIVNCSGAWSPDIGAMAKVKVPLTVMKHAYIVTEKIPGIENMPNVRDHDASVYLRLQGDSLLVGGYEPNPIFIDELGRDFAFGLYELDWDVFSVHIEGAVNRVPVLEKIGIRSTLATWIVQGRPSLDMFGYDIRRFTPRLTGNTQWVKERSHESYAKNYSIVFPHDEPLAARLATKSPLHKVLEDQGCLFQERQGYERPGWFTPCPAPLKPYDFYGSYGHKPHSNYTYNERLQDDYTFQFPTHHSQIERECLSCREKAAVFDMSYFGKFYLTGKDAKKAVDWICSASMDRKPGTTVYTCFLNKKGGIEADLTVSILKPEKKLAIEPDLLEGGGYYIAAGGGSSYSTWSHLQSVIQEQKYQVELKDLSLDMALISVQGPKRQAPYIAQCSSAQLPLILGWEIHCPSESAVKIYQALMEVGTPKGLINAGYRALDSLSIEKGFRHWHADVRMDTTPHEAGLAFTCKLKKGTPFLGREKVEEQNQNGVYKKIACFTLDEHVPLFGLETIWRNGLPVGHIYRGEYANALGKSIGYGYIHHPEKELVTADFLGNGTYELESFCKKYNAQIHLKSPFDPGNKRIKGIYDEPLPVRMKTS
ncbi:unnamed protein product [Darwinula stevensoni]|uniref:Sarcosine dehydrogenase, mitochondrial n=1 Tax=Darwinula stevensoni TaxID=69355 RepID=A0A7R8WZE9_9CRUS|nr:unnamed protein product [Darwinula stevensoni]CAG0880074.1 unnamed protein product [Darwinula stevensoni]